MGPGKLTAFDFSTVARVIMIMIMMFAWFASFSSLETVNEKKEDCR
jgi:hypothetical protein